MNWMKDQSGHRKKNNIKPQAHTPNPQPHQIPDQQCPIQLQQTPDHLVLMQLPHVPDHLAT